jgi:hypothetical protein
VFHVGVVCTSFHSSRFDLSNILKADALNASEILMTQGGFPDQNQRSGLVISIGDGNFTHLPRTVHPVRPGLRILLVAVYSEAVEIEYAEKTLHLGLISPPVIRAIFL